MGELQDTILSPWGAFAALPVMWMAWWSAERAYVYTFSTPDVMLSSSFRLFLPPDATEEWTGALGGAFRQMYDADREFMSRVVHVQMSAVMALCCIFNLIIGNTVRSQSPDERSKSYLAMLHRAAGQTLTVCYVPWTTFLFYNLFIHGMIPFGSLVEYADKAALLICAITFPCGVLYAKSKNWAAHRAMMICGSSSLLYIPLQRFIWRIFILYAGSIETFGHLGNYFMSIDVTFTGSLLLCSLLAFWSTKGTVQSWSFEEKVKEV